jgi:hypothetical protein
VQQLFKAPENGLWNGRFRAKLVHDETRPDEFARGIQVANRSKGDGLRTQVADSGGLHGAGNHGQLAGIGAELIEKSVLATSTDDADAF